MSIFLKIDFFHLKDKAKTGYIEEKKSAEQQENLDNGHDLENGQNR